MAFQVEKILIPYARTAKKMDMRKLKAIMWQILTDRGNEDKVGLRSIFARRTSIDFN